MKKSHLIAALLTAGVTLTCGSSLLASESGTELTPACAHMPPHTPDTGYRIYGNNPQHYSPAFAKRSREQRQALVAAGFMQRQHRGVRPGTVINQPIVGAAPTVVAQRQHRGVRPAK